MASLHFHYGTMGSSKSAQLIINAYNQNKNGNKTEIIKPKIDNRFSENMVNSRIGISAPATVLDNLNTYAPAPGTKMILVDEVQFFRPSDIDKLVHIADNAPIIVMCYGLMVDSNECIFPAARRLIEVGAKPLYAQANKSPSATVIINLCVVCTLICCTMIMKNSDKKNAHAGVFYGTILHSLSKLSRLTISTSSGFKTYERFCTPS